MTAAELDAFLADVRAQADAALARLATVDADALTPTLRAEYDAVRDGWQALRSMTADDVVELLSGLSARAIRIRIRAIRQAVLRVHLIRGYPPHPRGLKPPSP